MVPVQHHCREPAAGAGCDRCRAHPHDHSPAGQSKRHNYLSPNLRPCLSRNNLTSDATKVQFVFHDTNE